MYFPRLSISNVLPYCIGHNQCVSNFKNTLNEEDKVEISGNLIARVGDIEGQGWLLFSRLSLFLSVMCLVFNK